MMLVLTRRLGEEIVIAGNIHFKITAIRGQKVRLGITAPEAVSVVRQELRDRSDEPEPVSACSRGADRSH